MKKVLVALVSVLCLSGCGGGSTTTAGNSGGGGGGGGGSNPVGSTNTNFTLTITEGGSTASAKAIIPVQRSFPANQNTANSARIIFRNISTTTTLVPVVDVDGNPIPGQFDSYTQPTEIWKRVYDVAYTPGSNVSVAVPSSPARGYIVDVLTYFDDGSNHYNMVKYGRSAANIVISQTSVSGSVTVNTITPTITTPNPINSQDNYTVTVSTTMPLRNYYMIRQDLSDVSFASFASYSTHLLPAYNGNNPLKAPTTYADGTLYLPAQFFINDSMLGGTKKEYYANWTMIAPVTSSIIGLVSVSLTP